MVAAHEWNREAVRLPLGREMPDHDPELVSDNGDGLPGLVLGASSFVHPEVRTAHLIQFRYWHALVITVVRIFRRAQL